MTIDQLRKAHRATPFLSFTIRLADGRSFPVRHPEMLSMAPDAQRTFVVAQPNEDYSIIDLLMVVSIDFEPAGRRLAG